MNSGKENSDLQSSYEFNSIWADRIARLIILGLAVDIVVVFISGKSWLENILTIIADTLIITGVWGELSFARRAKEAGDGIVAKANERAAKADLARIELEAQLSPRMLNQRQLDLIKSFKDQFPAVNIGYETDAESWWFAMELRKSLHVNRHRRRLICSRPVSPHL